jgi:hypothetical protein
MTQAANAMPGLSPPIIRPPGSNYQIVAPVATQERLSKPHQLVVLFNSSEVQSYGIQDRFLQLQMLKPQEKREVAMIVDELATLIHLARTDRGFFTSGPNRGKPFPPHPLKILGLPPVQSRPIDDREMELSAKASALAAREQELIEREAKLNAAAGVQDAK